MTFDKRLLVAFPTLVVTFAAYLFYLDSFSHTFGSNVAFWLPFTTSWFVFATLVLLDRRKPYWLFVLRALIVPAVFAAGAYFLAFSFAWTIGTTWTHHR